MQKLDIPKDLVYSSSEVFAEDFLSDLVVEFNELRKQFVELHNKYIDLEKECLFLRNNSSNPFGW